MNYKVLKVCTRKSENMKVYNEGDLIELDQETAEQLIQQGIVQQIEQPKKKIT